ncbi:MAG: tripartite tricarboxylate transporter permease [Variovorax sp.]
MAYSAIGVALGLVFGAIPGLNQGVLMALTLPLTITMDNLLAQYLLVGMYVGGVSGGLTSGILLGIPGTPASVMSTFDGHAMAKRGQAARALALGITASLMGGLISWLLLATISVPIARVAVRFGQFEMAAMIVGGLLLIAAASQADTLKGLLAGLLGIVVALVGLDPVTSDKRFTFSFEALDRGLDLFPVLMGVFAIGGLLAETMPDRPVVEQVRTKIVDVLRAVGAIGRHKWNVVRSGLIGSWIGILPGAGANIGAIIAYVATQNIDSDPASFGSGREEGVVAAETGNNATVGGSLVPMIALGIPGAPADVFLMAALIFHNINLGPLLIRESPGVFFGIIATYLVANVLMFLILIVACVPLARIVNIPRHYLVPVILVCSTIGTYSINSQLFDVWVMFAFGAIGFAMIVAGIPTAPFVIGLVLAPLLETSLRSALMESDGSFLPFLTRPAAMSILIGSIVFALWPWASRHWRMRSQRLGSSTAAMRSEPDAPDVSETSKVPRTRR